MGAQSMPEGTAGLVRSAFTKDHSAATQKGGREGWSRKSQKGWSRFQAEEWGYEAPTCPHKGW